MELLGNITFFLEDGSIKGNAILSSNLFHGDEELKRRVSEEIFYDFMNRLKEAKIIELNYFLDS